MSISRMNADAGDQELSALKAAIETAEAALSQAKDHMAIAQSAELHSLEFGDLYTNVSPVNIVATSNFSTSLDNVGLFNTPSVE